MWDLPQWPVYAFESHRSLVLCWLLFAKMRQAKDALQEGTLIEELPLTVLSVCMSVEHFLD